MTKVCVVRNDSLPQEQLRAEGVVAVGWDDRLEADLIGRDYQAVRVSVREAYPEASTRRVGNWSGQLWLFCSAIEVGDVVVAPVRKTGTVDLGVVAGAAYWAKEASVHKFRRPVEWVELGTRRSRLSASSRSGLKSQLTCYKHRSGNELQEIVEARLGVDIEKVRHVLWGLIEEVKGAQFDVTAYEDIARSGDPVRAIRELIGQPSAGPTFTDLHSAGTKDLSLESLVLKSPKELGAPAFTVDRARDRLEFYGA